MQKGIYRHTKSGHLYELVDSALSTETNEKMVAYRALYRHDELADEYGEYPLFVRPYDMFFDTVEINGVKTARFQRVDMLRAPVFITGNKHKADYLSRLIEMPLQHQSISLDEIQSTNLDDIVKCKARQAYEIIKKPVLVEDVSLGFSALDGLPGPFIRFFTEPKDGLENLCRMLDSFDDRRATAACVYGYCDGDQVRLFRGQLEGSVASHPRGDNGFGWDRIFCPDGYGGKTRAELDSEADRATYLKLKPIAELRDFLSSLDHS